MKGVGGVPKVSTIILESVTMKKSWSNWLIVMAVLGLTGCGGGARPGGQPAPNAERTLTDLFDLPSVYTRMGRLASGPPVPFVASVVYLKGRGDSTVVRVAISLANNSLSFQRDDRAFAARFRGEVLLEREGTPPLNYFRDEIIRVASFDETQISEETIIFQQSFLLEPGDYKISLSLRDLGANAVSRAERPITVPEFGSASLTAPILVYEAAGRVATSDSARMILNPRGTVSHGSGDTLLIYLEGYNFPGPTRVPVQVRDDQQTVVFADTLRFVGGRDVESQLIRLNANTPPLGELVVSAGVEGGSVAETKALVSFARGWVVTNYDNLLDLLRFYWYPQWVARLREANTSQRPDLWRQFWAATDPAPETPANESLDLYFTRVAIANRRFREEGINAWRSERGEVYITLGEPDQINTSSPGADNRLEQWIYSEYRGSLIFQGQFGFSRLRLTPASRSEFARLRTLVQRR